MALADWISWRDGVLTGLAVYAALLSTFNLYQALKKDRRSVTVRYSTVVEVSESGSNSRSYSKISVINTGHRPVIVTEIGFEIYGLQKLHDLETNSKNTPLPVSLADGEAAYLYVANAEIGSWFLKNRISKTVLRPFCIDTAGVRYTAQMVDVDAVSWAAS